MKTVDEMRECCLEELKIWNEDTQSNFVVVKEIFDDYHFVLIVKNELCVSYVSMYRTEYKATFVLIPFGVEAYIRSDK
jgi:hypothetical protein